MDDMKPWLSVVIPCYNGADLVGATIRSVIDQAGPSTCRDSGRPTGRRFPGGAA
ncbi:MAG: glycosyltransferase [Planctomycetota bacterium]